MITETISVSETNETAAMMQSVGVTDEIRRNHLQQKEITQISDVVGATDFTVKFARLKKALRKRSSNIF